MTFLDRILVILICIFATLAAGNAKEAHRHTHELACHVGAVELCDYHEVKQ